SRPARQAGRDPQRQRTAWSTSRSPLTFPVLFARARAAQKMHDVEIVFVTPVLVHLLGRIDLGPRDQGGPRLGPGRRIFDRELVVDRVGGDTREALRDSISRG